MFRNIASIVVALAIITALTGGACLACFTPVKKTVSTQGCCNTGKTCHKSSKQAPSRAADCKLGEAVDLSSVEKPADKTNMLVAQPLEPAMVLVAAAAERSRIPKAIEPVRRPYTADVCLLNSVLTI